MVQFIMGVMALSSLVWKRYHEHPHRRPWIIWFYDVSKQVLGALMIHVLNLFASILRATVHSFIMIIISDDNDNDNNDNDSCSSPCDYYFLNILFDTTIGIPILYFFICCITEILKRGKITGIESGEYGNPPNFQNYFKQFSIYILSLILTKFSIYIIMVIFPIVADIADWLLSGLDKYPDLQISFVLLIFPMIMNVFQYYVIDNLIQSKEYYVVNKQVQEIGIYRDNDDIEEAIPELCQTPLLQSYQ